MWPFGDGEHIHKFANIGKKSIDGLLEYGFIEKTTLNKVKRTDAGKTFLEGVSKKYPNATAKDWYEAYR